MPNAAATAPICAEAPLQEEQSQRRVHTGLSIDDMDAPLSSLLHLVSQALTALSFGSSVAAASNAAFAVSNSSSSKDATLRQHDRH